MWMEEVKNETFMDIGGETIAMEAPIVPVKNLEETDLSDDMQVKVKEMLPKTGNRVHLAHVRLQREVMKSVANAGSITELEKLHEDLTVFPPGKKRDTAAKIIEGRIKALEAQAKLNIGISHRKLRRALR